MNHQSTHFFLPSQRSKLRPPPPCPRGSAGGCVIAVARGEVAISFGEVQATRRILRTRPPSWDARALLGRRRGLADQDHLVERETPEPRAGLPPGSRLSDQRLRRRKYGHMGGKVLVPTQEALLAGKRASNCPSRRHPFGRAFPLGRSGAARPASRSPPLAARRPRTALPALAHRLTLRPAAAPPLWADARRKREQLPLAAGRRLRLDKVARGGPGVGGFGKAWAACTRPFSRRPSIYAR